MLSRVVSYKSRVMSWLQKKTQFGLSLPTTPYSLLITSACVNTVYLLRNNVGKAVDYRSINPHVVFTAMGLRIKTAFTPSLYNLNTQSYTHKILDFNRSNHLLINHIHRPNNNDNKGE